MTCVLIEMLQQRIGDMHCMVKTLRLKDMPIWKVTSHKHKKDLMSVVVMKYLSYI